MTRRFTASRGPAQGFSLTELLVGVTVLLLLAGLAIQAGGESMARQRLEVATRRLVLGIERGRSAAERQGRPCGLSLAPGGWQEPQSGSLAGCEQAAMPLGEGVENGTIELSHNLPDTLRFSSNGLVLDGGTVVLSSEGTELRRCLVMALPLGVVRVGRYGGAPGGRPDSSACSPDSSL
ncbi:MULTISPECIES: GspH/FimT family protein [unclassified Synechococcus]|uniref:GspH/FimT family pseudopilin n=1 Tax=unclassified Synechococcus TaxID=2626047 RepID=UPI000069901A|nr:MULTISPECIES: GspH/FimT family protein [unclassified Synechococcus]EAQ74289.1 hypothetical protein WH5701_06646 [Synechococcus sp. WH 5701]WFN60073.1 GspH/FimT family protein [Synechococcus sp. CCFWC 502]CAK6699447.1 hypothetical protein ICNINCKA_02643 [Synechococcus sp. CBW1107]